MKEIIIYTITAPLLGIVIWITYELIMNARRSCVDTKEWNKTL